MLLCQLTPPGDRHRCCRDGIDALADGLAVVLIGPQPVRVAGRMTYLDGVVVDSTDLRTSRVDGPATGTSSFSRAPMLAPLAGNSNLGSFAALAPSSSATTSPSLLPVIAFTLKLRQLGSLTNEVFHCSQFHSFGLALVGRVFRNVRRLVGQQGRGRKQPSRASATLPSSGFVPLGRTSPAGVQVTMESSGAAAGSRVLSGVWQRTGISTVSPQPGRLPAPGSGNGRRTTGSPGPRIRQKVDRE